LQRCLAIAKERGIEKVMGTVLAENTQMLALGIEHREWVSMS